MEADSSTAELAARVRRLEDIEEIRRLRSDYHHFVNSGQFDRVSSLFCEDGVIDLGYLGRYDGRAAIHAGYLAMGARDRFMVQQFPHCHTVDVDGDSATAYSYLDARYARFGVSYVVVGRYDDVFRRTTEGWSFVSMTFDIRFTVPSGLGWAGDELHYLRPDMWPTRPAPSAG
ncbi:nuclear transport factor 2 family protein [Blastococcus sp. SYSU D00669]